jgi:hypothetical protein
MPSLSGLFKIPGVPQERGSEITARSIGSIQPKFDDYDSGNERVPGRGPSKRGNAMARQRISAQLLDNDGAMHF